MYISNIISKVKKTDKMKEKKKNKYWPIIL